MGKAKFSTSSSLATFAWQRFWSRSTSFSQRFLRLSVLIGDDGGVRRRLNGECLTGGKMFDADVDDDDTTLLSKFFRGVMSPRTCRCMALVSKDLSGDLGSIGAGMDLGFAGLEHAWIKNWFMVGDVDGESNPQPLVSCSSCDARPRFVFSRFNARASLSSTLASTLLKVPLKGDVVKRLRGNAGPVVIDAGTVVIVVAVVMLSAEVPTSILAGVFSDFSRR